MLNYGRSDHCMIINNETQKPLLMNAKPFTTYSRQKAHEILSILTSRKRPYAIVSVIHYCPDPRQDFNVKCSSGDAHRGFTDERKKVNCPRCLQRMGMA